MYRLRRETKVTNDGNTCRCELTDCAEEVRTSLKLDCICTRLLHDADSRSESGLRTDLIAPEGHVYDDKGTLHTTDYTGTVVDHLIESNR